MSRAGLALAVVSLALLFLLAFEGGASGINSLGLGGLWRDLLDLPTELHRGLTDAVRALKEGPPAHAAFVLMAISAAYGVAHAAGPGHGKIVLSSYLLADPRSARAGIGLAFAAALVQALSAILIVLVGTFVLQLAGLRLGRLASGVETASMGLVLLVGVGMIVAGVRGLLAGSRRVAAESRHHYHEGCGHDHTPLPPAGHGGLLKSIGVVLAVGARPCTGAIIVLVFAMVNGLFLAGVAATLAMALGTAVTVSALALLAVHARSLAQRLVATSERKLALLGAGLWLGGGFLVTASAATFLLTPARSGPF